MEGSSPARLYCLLVGGVLVVAGIIGFFYEASFAVGNEIVAETCSGSSPSTGGTTWSTSRSAACCWSWRAGRAPGALFVGVLYLVLAGLGFIATGDGGIGFIAENGVLIDLVPVNDEDNLLHVILGVTGVIAGLATGKSAVPRPPSGRIRTWARPLRRRAQ